MRAQFSKLNWSRCFQSPDLDSGRTGREARFIVLVANSEKETTMREKEKKIREMEKKMRECKENKLYKQALDRPVGPGF